MKNKEDVFKLLRDEAGQVVVAGCGGAEPINKILKQQEAQKAAEKQKTKNLYRKLLAMAAAICIVVFGATAVGMYQKIGSDQTGLEETAYEAEKSDETMLLETADAGLEYPEISYEDIYESISKTC